MAPTRRKTYNKRIQKNYMNGCVENTVNYHFFSNGVASDGFTKFKGC